MAQAVRHLDAREVVLRELPVFRAPVGAHVIVGGDEFLAVLDLVHDPLAQRPGGDRLDDHVVETGVERGPNRLQLGLLGQGDRDNEGILAGFAFADVADCLKGFVGLGVDVHEHEIGLFDSDYDDELAQVVAGRDLAEADIAQGILEQGAVRRLAIDVHDLGPLERDRFRAIALFRRGHSRAFRFRTRRKRPIRANRPIGIYG